eukprot:scaffold2146_cov425-Prasinococcus_capsulatus_cf.AAC.4
MALTGSCECRPCCCCCCCWCACAALLFTWPYVGAMSFAVAEHLLWRAVAPGFVERTEGAPPTPPACTSRSAHGALDGRAERGTRVVGTARVRGRDRARWPRPRARARI